MAGMRERHKRRGLFFGLVFSAFFLLCAAAGAFVKGDVAYIEAGAWWTTTPGMLDVISGAITAKDYGYLARLENSEYFNIQKVRIKVVVVTEMGGKVKVRVFGVDRMLIDIWIWASLLTKK